MKCGDLSNILTLQLERLEKLKSDSAEQEELFG